MLYYSLLLHCKNANIVVIVGNIYVYCFYIKSVRVPDSDLYSNWFCRHAVTSACGYARLQGLYSSFMTDNIVRNRLSFQIIDNFNFLTCNSNHDRCF